jgi:hypothetical protein
VHTARRLAVLRDPLLPSRFLLRVVLPLRTTPGPTRSETSEFFELTTQGTRTLVFLIWRINFAWPCLFCSFVARIPTAQSMANWSPAGSVLGGAAHLAGMVAVMRGAILVQLVCTPRDACGRACRSAQALFCVLTSRGDAVLYCAAAGGTPRGRHVRQKGRRRYHQASSEAAHCCYGGALRHPPPRQLLHRF